MLTHLRHVPARGLSPSLGLLAEPRRAASTKVKENKLQSIMKVTTPVAEKLLKSNIWVPRSRAPRGPAEEKYSLAPVDSRRVNIVSEKLCDDIVKMLGPSLDRHHGCDILDINPGVCVWSRALHDAVQPRRHIMLDTSAKKYKKFREEMMGDRPNIEVIQKSGIIFDDLNEVLASHIDTHHKRLPPGEQPERNDTLLITANISNFPKRSLWHFENVSTMVLYQIISNIRSSTVFQRYGLVRMLIWINDDNKRRVLPRSILGRKRAAFEAELACDWIHEVAGHDEPDPTTERLSMRDQWLHYESAAETLQRMEQQGLVTPPGRETRIMKEIKSNPAEYQGKLAGHRPPIFNRLWKKELEERGALGGEGHEELTIRRLQGRDKSEGRTYAKFLELLQLHESLLSMDPSTPEFAAADRDFNERIDLLKKNHRNDFLLLRDSYHIFRHHPTPALLWDRRAYEPLAVDPTDFYPNEPTCLLDIQPKAMDPILRQHGPSSTRSGDYANLLMRSLFANTTHPVYPKAMDNFWPGLADMALQHCPSLWDAKAGGSPISGHGGLVVRTMAERQWIEVVEAMMKWPFRPTYYQMLGRMSEGEDEDGDEGVHTGAGTL